VEQWTVNHTAEEVMTLLQKAGVSAGILEKAEDLHRDPQLAARHHFWTLEHREIGASTYDGMGSVLSETPAELNRAAPMLGQDNLEVYTQILGLSETEFIDLVQQGVFE